MHDEYIAEILGILKETKITLHLRGTERKSVLEFKDKRTRRVIGGTEFNRRTQAIKGETNG